MAYFRGTPAADMHKGGAENDVLDGLGGNDTLWGLDGDDTVYGGAGHDGLSGDRGNDELHGEWGNDRLHGGEGDDVLHGGHGDDMLDGGAGDDELHGGAGDDRIRGGDGDDLVVGLSGSDTIDGGAGIDTLDLSGVAGSSAGYGVVADTTDAASGSVYDYGTSTTSRLSNVERIVGTAQNDFVFQGDGDDFFDGGGGDDFWSGGEGADTFIGGDPWADDRDTASYANAEAGVVAALNSYNTNGGGEARGDTLLFVENLIGSRFADTLTGDTGDNEISGGGGRDELRALTGSDTLTGGGGADTFVFHKSTGGSHYGSSWSDTDRGDDLITDYVADVDEIRLVGYRADEVSVRDSGADAVIDAGWHVDIRVAGAAGELAASDLILA